jgi:hypothetical protein
MAPLHGASARESRVSVAIYSLDVVGHPGLLQSGLTSLCFVGCFSPGPRKNDLTIYRALGPFVRSFTPLVDLGDIYPPQAQPRKTTNSNPPDPRARTRAQPLKTTNSDPPDPRARTRAQPRKTTNSASPDPRARTQPWPQPTVSASPDPGARTRPRPRKTDSTSTSTSEEPPHRPT